MVDITHTLIRRTVESIHIDSGTLTQMMKTATKTRQKRRKNKRNEKNANIMLIFANSHMDSKHDKIFPPKLS